jgi:signal transduction histidine kinase
LKGKKIQIQIVEESAIPSVYVDPLRVKQVLLNLMGNAVKFTEQGHIRIRYGLHNTDMIYIKIQDSGVGISAEHIDKLFERFRQVDQSSTRRAGGTGLGLSLAREFVRMHGGDIYVESEFGVGSTFWFTLPIHKVEVVQQA